MGNSSSSSLQLGLPGFAYADLHNPDRLRELHFVWRDALASHDAALAARYDRYLETRGKELAPEELSALLVALAPTVSSFVERLFGVGEAAQALRDATAHEMIVLRFKDEFVKRRTAKKKVDDRDQAIQQGRAALQRHGVTDLDGSDAERRVAIAVCRLLDREAELKKGAVDDPQLLSVRSELAAIEGWAAAERERLAKQWLSFRFPHTLPDPFALVELRRPNADRKELIVGPEHHRRQRHGFQLTDRRAGLAEVLDQVDYCLYCHDRDKDSCSKGLRDNKTGAIKPNALGVPLEGCPLDEKISEMHLLRRSGDVLGALALVCIDNPMLPGTGHRICNDCMKACVYQKQEPVNIPQIETSVLTDTLKLPWGFEIYGFLQRWNPLNARRPYPLPYRGKNVLVVGMGPAGYTLSHHLLQEGFGVVGIDGLKVEPLPNSLLNGTPIRDFSEYVTELDERVLLGFGGVSEYGITVRWDKNFLTVLYATLARRDKFRVYGGVRLGGTLTLEDAWAMGMHHVAIAVGAGKPTMIDIENNLERGIRKASDFLMALQLQGAYKRSSLANLQVRLPAVVIGSGLTAIDTATELSAYYIVQAEKTLERYETLRKERSLVDAGEVEKSFDVEEREVLAELLEHGRQIRAERERAAATGEEPRLARLIDQWGGVTIVYRKRMVDSPAYRLNHEEVHKAFEEGVRFLENMSPKRAELDNYGAVRAMKFERQELGADGKWSATGEIIELPARTVCVAAGTSPNTIYEKEYPGTFAIDKRGFFVGHTATVGEGGAVTLTADRNGFFTSYQQDGRLVSYYGDNHPRYAGSVVKAMASAKHGYEAVAAVFPPGPTTSQPELETGWKLLVKQLDDTLLAKVVEVRRLTSQIVEVVVHAPLAARKFQPGQFYRLQNFESLAPTVDGTRLSMEGLALTGAWTDPVRGLLSMIVLEMGGSSRLCALLKAGEPVVVMGPTGTPTEIPNGEDVLLAGGGLGNAVLFSIGRALRAQGCRVLYFAGYRRREDLFYLDEIEAAADQVIWSVDQGPAPEPRRPQDRAFVGNVVQAMVAYAEDRLGERLVDLERVRRVIAIGSDRMMRAVKEARHSLLAAHIGDHHAVGSINSPMQCMMKEICAQCLQKHTDPATGKEHVVFSCYNQDQNLDSVNFNHLASRLKLNSVQEKLSDLWLQRLLKRGQLTTI